MLSRRQLDTAKDALASIDKFLHHALMPRIQGSKEFEPMRDCREIVDGIQTLQSLDVFYDNSQRVALDVMTSVLQRKFNVFLDQLRKVIALRASGNVSNGPDEILGINSKHQELCAAYRENAIQFASTLSDDTHNWMIKNLGEIHVGDKYEISNNGQIGAIGTNAKAEGNFFSQRWSELESQVDLGELASELATLRAELRKSASSVEEDQVIANIGSAENAAKQKDGPSALKFLKAAGQWALDVATKVGTTVAAKAIENAILK